MRAHGSGADTAAAILLRLNILSRIAEFKARRKPAARARLAETASPLSSRSRLNIRGAIQELLRLTAALPAFSEARSENCVGGPPSAAAMTHPAVRTPAHAHCAQQRPEPADAAAAASAGVTGAGPLAGADGDQSAAGASPAVGDAQRDGADAAGSALRFGCGAGEGASAGVAVADPWSSLPDVGCLPYHWQLRRPGEAWESVPARAQEVLERVFCNPDNERAELHAQGELLSLDFATMQATSPASDRLLLLARRLESSRFAPGYPRRFYRRDQSRWLRLDEAVTEIITSSVAAGIFNLGQWPLIRMRPEFVSFLATSQHRDAPVAADGGSAACSGGGAACPGCPQPSTWVAMDAGADFARVALEPAERAFRAAYRLFHKTVTETKALVLGIERVQNPFLWEKYCRKKAFLLRKLPQTTERELELHLFHGTAADTVPAICKHNFDPRLSGKHAAVYGQGSYFSTTASFSHGYAGRPGEAGDRYVFIAKVLVGRYTGGRPGLRRPPPLRPGDLAGDLYDSCVDDSARPSIFAIFDSDQCYPYFLIRYRVIKNVVQL